MRNSDSAGLRAEFRIEIAKASKYQSMFLKESGWRGRIRRYFPLVLWMGVVLFLGSGAGSAGETSRFVRPILEFLFPSASEEIFALYHALIRKSAHFIEYAVLTVFAARALSGSSIKLLSKYWWAVSILLVLAVAAIDEITQSTDISRTGSGLDVLIDLSGGLAAVLVLWLTQNRWPTNRILQNTRRSNL